MTTHADDATLQANVQEVLPGLRRDLEDLVRIQSVSADPERAAAVQRSAATVRDPFPAQGLDAPIARAHAARRLSGDCSPRRGSLPAS